MEPVLSILGETISRELDGNCCAHVGCDFQLLYLFSRTAVEIRRLHLIVAASMGNPTNITWDFAHAFHSNVDMYVWAKCCFLIRVHEQFSRDFPSSSGEKRLRERVDTRLLNLTDGKHFSIFRRTNTGRRPYCEKVLPLTPAATSKHRGNKTARQGLEQGGSTAVQGKAEPSTHSYSS
jgi:hypothetical protein